MMYIDGEEYDDEALYPYMGYNENSDWVAAIYDDTVPQIIDIPSVYRDYTYVVDENIHESVFAVADATSRVTEIGSAMDDVDINYYVENHLVRGNGLILLKIPPSAEGGTISHDRAAIGKVRLAYLDDDISRYDFSDFGNFQNLGMFSHEIGLPAGSIPTEHVREAIRYTGVPSHHFSEGVVFSAKVTSIGMNDLHLCDSEGIRHATVLETVEYEQTLPHGHGIFEISEEVFKITRFYKDSGASNYEQSQKASAGIRGQFNALEGDSYNRARTSIEILDGQDPNYEGDLTYCRNGEGNKGKGFMITHPFEQTNKVTISYEFTPQVLDFNSLPVGTLDEWLSQFPLVNSGDKIYGVTDHTYLVIESGSEESRFKIRYDSREGRVESTTSESRNLLDIIGHRTFNDTTISFQDGKINVAGQGLVLVQLDNTNLQANQDGIVINGALSDETTMRVVQSPHDLVHMEHDDDKGFILGNSRSNKVPLYFNIPGGTTPLSVKIASYSYDQNVEFDRSKRPGLYGRPAWDHIEYSNLKTGDTTNIRILPDNGYNKISSVSPPVEILPYEYVRNSKVIRDSYASWADNFRVTIYDTLPAKGGEIVYTGDFETPISIPSGDDVYLAIDSNGGSSEIDLQITPQTTMTISDLKHALNSTKNPDGTLYYIEKGGIGIKTGVVNDRITVDTEIFDIAVGSGAKLYLYHDALMENINGNDEVFFFDSKNEEITPFDALNIQYLYNSHAYVKLPQFTTPMEIVSIKLESTHDDFGEYDEINMDYLAGEYGQFEDVFIPVLTGFQEVHMVVKPVNASDTENDELEENTRAIRMRVEDVPNDAGVKIIPKQHSVRSTLSNDVASARAGATSTVFFIAKESGTTSVIVDIPVEATASFSITTEQSSRYHGAPPRPSCGTSNLHVGGSGNPLPWCKHNWRPTPPSFPSISSTLHNFKASVERAMENGQLSKLVVSAHIVVNGELLKTEILYAPDDVTIEPSIGRSAARADFSSSNIYKVIEFDTNAGDFIEIVIEASVYADGIQGERMRVNPASISSQKARDCRCDLPSGFDRWAYAYVTRDVVFSSAAVSLGPGVMFFTD